MTIEELNAKYGKPTTSMKPSSAIPAQDRVAEIKKLWGDTPVEPSFKASVGGAETIVPNVLKTIGNIPSDVAGTIKTAIVDPAKKIQESEKLVGEIYKNRGAVEGTKDIIKGTGETLSNIFQAPGKAIVGLADKNDLVDHLAPIQEQTVKQRDEILKKLQEAKSEGKDTSHLVKALKYVTESLASIDSQIGSKEERKNKEIQTYTDIAKYPIEHPAQVAIAAETLNPKTQAGISNKLKPITEPIEAGVDVAKNKATSVANATVNKVKSPFISKTKEEILATPEDKLHKLSAPERKLYFDTQAEAIAQKGADLEVKIKKGLEESSAKAQSEAEALKRELDVASRDEVIELRPKIVKAMGEQSKVYRNLIKEEMAGKENIPIKVDDLKTHIDTQYGDNPAMAAAIKERLGLTEAPEALKKGQIPTIQTEASTKTLGELYEKTKSLKQDISTGATKGSKVFTSEDKLTDDAIHTLTDFMKKNGVDFSAANKFWAKYAPIRNQLVTEAKPFLQTGTQTKTFANTLTRVAKGTDVNNENFIKEVENLLGEPVAKKTKDALTRLSAKEKEILAQEVEAQAQKAELKLAQEKEMKKLSEAQFKVEQRAYKRKIIKGILVGTIGGAAALKIGEKVVNAAGL